jgi:hypothetical protein
MKAIVYRKNGPPEVLTCEEIEKPTPSEQEVLIKVRAAAVNPLDYHMLKGGPAIFRLLFGRAKLKRPGVDCAGVVEAVGSAVTQLKAGDAVFGTCRGAFAEYADAPESKLVSKPSIMLRSEMRLHARLRLSQHYRGCVITEKFSPARTFSSTAHRAAWAHSPCSLPKSSVRSVTAVCSV